jgi:DNA replication protein DnaC
MNGTVERIRLYAKQLKLPSFGEYQSLARDASESHWGYEEFLVELLKTELEHRQANQKQRLIRAARFPLIKTLDCFDFANLKNIDPVVVWDLSGNEYLRRRENIIFIGNPGTGKSHLSIALGLLRVSGWVPGAILQCPGTRH